MSTFDPAEIVQILKQHIVRGYESQAVAEAWRKLPEIPSSGEIMGNRIEPANIYDSDDDDDDLLQQDDTTNLPVNITDGPWNSIGEYVGSHYQLLREDAVGPLRHALSIYRSTPSMGDTEDVAIYTHVNQLHNRYGLYTNRVQ
jgi:helicase required for RNAi-mediated heterochromatin assembly 1